MYIYAPIYWHFVCFIVEQIVLFSVYKTLLSSSYIVHCMSLCIFKVEQLFSEQYSRHCLYLWYSACFREASLFWRSPRWSMAETPSPSTRFLHRRLRWLLFSNIRYVNTVVQNSALFCNLFNLQTPPLPVLSFHSCYMNIPDRK